MVRIKRLKDFSHYENGVKVVEHFNDSFNPNIKYVWIGNLGAILSILAALYFIINTSVYKTTVSISYIWLIGIIITSSLWLIFGMINKIQPTILSSSLALVGYIYLFIFKVITERAMK